MEILIIFLGLGFLALIGFSIKFISDDKKQERVVEDTKGKKISDLESETTRKDSELKKMMEERQRLEDEFFKAKDEADIFKRDNAELSQKMKQLEKSKEESAEIKSQIKQKDLMLQQETVARQKLQGELALKDNEAEKLTKEMETLKSELKSKTDMLEGLKGQFNELENELTKVRQEALQKREPAKKPQEVKPVMLEIAKPEDRPEIAPNDQKPPEVKKELPKSEPQKTDQEKKVPEVKQPAPVSAGPELKPAPINPLPEKIKLESNQGAVKDIKELPKDASAEKKPLPASLQEPSKDDKSQKQDKPLEAQKKPEEIPGFPKPSGVKVEIKKGVPSDTDFLKAEPAKKPEVGSQGEFPEGAFKVTEAMKKDAQAKPPVAAPQKKPVPPQEKDKNKTRKETLIPGFHPKDETQPD